MSDLWPLSVILAVGVVLLVGLRVGPRLFAGTRFVTHAFRCPFGNRDVAVQFEERVWDSKRVAVDRCSFFSPPTAVDCHKNCLRLGFLPPVQSSQVPSLR